jgi:YegS/Rv2252/BmrU family lipid kinase
LLLVNPSAGGRKSKRAIAAARRFFCPPKWRLLTHTLSGPKEASALALQAARKKYFAVLVAGGDGTVNEVAGALAFTKTRLGIIPSGTGNGFARALGIPLDYDKACQALERGRSFKCDLGLLSNGRFFANVCGVGIDAWIAERANRLRWMNRYSGFLRYFMAGLHSLSGFKAGQLQVRLGSRIHKAPLLLAVIANSEQYGFGTVIAPGAGLDDGLFDVVLLSPLTFLQFLKNFLRLYQRKPLLGSLRFHAKEIEISSNSGAIPVHLDGEPAGWTPVKVSLKRRALEVLIP